MARLTLILTTGRCGSSMVAGILAKHGAWTGDTTPGNHFNEKGYFENQEIKRTMIRRFGRDWLGSFPESDPLWLKEVESIKKKQGYKSGPWLFKTGAFYWKVWIPCEPTFVKVFRKRSDILSSYHRSGFLRSQYTDTAVAEIVDRQIKAMKYIPGIDIDADALVDGDTSQIKKAIEASGLIYCPKITNDFIEKDLWNKT